jgi:hypothetical protein
MDAVPSTDRMCEQQQKQSSSGSSSRGGTWDFSPSVHARDSLCEKRGALSSPQICGKAISAAPRSSNKTAATRKTRRGMFSGVIPVRIASGNDGANRRFSELCARRRYSESVPIHRLIITRWLWATSRMQLDRHRPSNGTADAENPGGNLRPGTFWFYGSRSFARHRRPWE